MLSRAFAGGLLVLGGWIAVQAAFLGTPGFRSLINAESIFAVAVVAALCLRSAHAEQPTRRNSNGRDTLLAATIPVLIVVLYGRSASFGFLSDDFVLLRLASAGASYRSVFTQGGGDGFFRPLGYISLAWTGPWAGTSPAAWHWAGLALHMATSLVVFFLAGWLGFSRPAAWFAATLFAMHGSRPEAVAWMAGRFDLLAGLFTMVSLAAFVRAWERPTWLWWLLAMLPAALGMLSKESAYALPLMVAVFALAQPGTWMRRIQFVAPVTILAAILFAYRWTRLAGIGGYLTTEGHPQALSLSLLAVVKALAWRLWAVLFFPVNWTEPHAKWMAAVVIAYAAAWAALVWTGRPRRGLLLMGVGFTLAAAVPPVQQLLIGADLEKARLLYLPAVGFCLFAAAAVEGAGARVKVAAMTAVLVFQAVALERNLRAWEYASGKAAKVCEAVAACSNLPSGVPRTLRGVYFFANGLPECAAMHRQTDAPVHECSLRWDATEEELK